MQRGVPIRGFVPEPVTVTSPPSDSHDRVLLEITPGKDGGLPHPCFKSDGQRFAEADTTLKLVREGRYTLSFVCSPPATITLAEMLVGARENAAPDLAVRAGTTGVSCMHGRIHTHTQTHMHSLCTSVSCLYFFPQQATRGLGVPLILDLSGGIVDAALGISTHSVEWTCSLEACKKNARHALEVHLDVQVGEPRFGSDAGYGVGTSCPGHANHSHLEGHNGHVTTVFGGEFIGLTLKCVSQNHIPSLPSLAQEYNVSIALMPPSPLFGTGLRSAHAAAAAQGVRGQ